MQLALPQFDQRETYHRLATVYTIVFGVAAASFYLTLFRSGSDFSLALFAAIAAALHYSLLRLAGSVPAAQDAPLLQVRRYTPSSLLAHSDLISRLDQLRQEARSSHDEVGLMLIMLDDDEYGHNAPEIVRLVRGELFRAADSRIFQVDEQTLAVAEAHYDVVLHFDKIALEVQRQLRTAKPHMAADSPHATIGISVASSGRSSPAEMMDGARTAIRLAEANHRDTFFRRVS